MTKLKLGPLVDEKPVRLTVELPAQVHRDLLAYADALGRETASAAPVEAAKLVGPMLARFMATDREFAKQRRSGPSPLRQRPPSPEPESLDVRATGSGSV